MKTLPPLKPDVITTLDGQILTPHQWREERNREWGNGASELPTIAGVHGSVVKLWYRKKELIADEPEQPEQAWWGHRNEDALAELFEAETGKRLAQRQVFVRHREHPWLVALLDGLTDGIEREIVELKLLTLYGHDHEGWVWDPARPPAKWRIQAHQQMACLHTDHVLFGVLYTPTMTFTVIRIDWDEQLWANLFPLAQQFRQSLIDDKPPTDFVADDAGLIGKVYRGQDTGPELELDDPKLETAARVYFETGNVHAIERERDKAKAALLQAMGTSTKATVAGYTIDRRTTAKMTKLEVTPPVEITVAPADEAPKPERMSGWLHNHLKTAPESRSFGGPEIPQAKHPAPTALELKEFSMRLRHIARNRQDNPEVIVRIYDAMKGTLFLAEEREWIIERFWGLRPWGFRKHAVAMSQQDALDLFEDYPGILEGAVTERVQNRAPSNPNVDTRELSEACV